MGCISSKMASEVQLEPDLPPRTQTTTPQPAPESSSPTRDSIFNYPTITDRTRSILTGYISSTYEGHARPEPYEFLMNGTLFMIQKSLSMVAATQLTAPLARLPEGPKAEVPRAHTLAFEKCSKCAGDYIFRLPHGNGNVTIIKGAPRAETPPYKAMSYVWGSSPQTPLRIPCGQCGHVTLVPMSHAQWFINLMELGGSGNTIWLDALSIDQSDPADVASIVSVMGTIYKNARCVSVLLPSSDEEAFRCLEEIELNAKAILFHHRHFIENKELVLEDLDTGERVELLTYACQHFLHNIQLLRQNLDRFAYWNRAWTFQEWALANDLEVVVEGGSGLRPCFNLKSVALGAAMLITRYKLSLFHYATINVGQSRGMIPALFDMTKSLFPDEDLFLSYEEIDPEKLSLQTNFPHFGVDQLLGVRTIPVVMDDTGEMPMTSLSPRPDPLAQMRARLILLLSSFASSKRDATFDADLVASWASMCNVAYAYDRNDDFMTALKKVTKVLRARGLPIYHFLPDTTGGLRSPADAFRAYAMQHRQLNATNRAAFPGAPIFTGRADTVTHLLISLQAINVPTQWSPLPDDDPGESMRKVKGAEVTDRLTLDDVETAMSKFAQKVVYGVSWDILSGTPMALLFLRVEQVGTPLLGSVPAEQRAMAKLVIVKIPFYPARTSQDTQSHDLITWTIVPSDITLQDVLVCREPLNGTLALSTQRDGVRRIVAYLTMSDHFSGTFLVKVDQAGGVDLSLRVPERGDVSVPIYHQIAVRQLCGRVELEGI